MAAYIVGMIAGVACMIAPLVYLGHLNSCMATILSNNPTALEKFVPLTHTGLMYAIVIVGAVVFILSALMTAFTGVNRMKGAREKGARPEPLDEPEMPEI
ncbi:MAG: hypothetical protein PVJ27_08590 [Candidatus Brocadiaceae bacterium]|jgi:hypothetical protein